MCGRPCFRPKRGKLPPVARLFTNGRGLSVAALICGLAVGGCGTSQGGADSAVADGSAGRGGTTGAGGAGGAAALGRGRAVARPGGVGGTGAAGSGVAGTGGERRRGRGRRGASRAGGRCRGRGRDWRCGGRGRERRRRRRRQRGQRRWRTRRQVEPPARAPAAAARAAAAAAGGGGGAHAADAAFCAQQLTRRRRTSGLSHDVHERDADPALGDGGTEPSARSASDWTSGFPAGSYWLLYERTGDAAWRTAAEACTAALAPQTTRTEHHDVGFVINNTLRQRLPADAERGLPDRRARGGGVAGVALRRHRRLHALVGLRVVDVPRHHRQHDEPRAPVPRDRARRRGARSRQIAITHALTTRTNHFRADAELVPRRRLQPDHGRGHPQADQPGPGRRVGVGARPGLGPLRLHDGAIARRATRASSTRRAHRRLLHAEPRMPADGVPYFDFDAPTRTRRRPITATLPRARSRRAACSSWRATRTGAAPRALPRVRASRRVRSLSLGDGYRAATGHKQPLPAHAQRRQLPDRRRDRRRHELRRLLLLEALMRCAELRYDSRMPRGPVSSRVSAMVSRAGHCGSPWPGVRSRVRLRRGVRRLFEPREAERRRRRLGGRRRGARAAARERASAGAGGDIDVHRRRVRRGQPGRQPAAVPVRRRALRRAASEPRCRNGRGLRRRRDGRCVGSRGLVRRRFRRRCGQRRRERQRRQRRRRRQGGRGGQPDRPSAKRSTSRTSFPVTR